MVYENTFFRIIRWHSRNWECSTTRSTWRRGQRFAAGAVRILSTISFSHFCGPTLEQIPKECLDRRAPAALNAKGRLPIGTKDPTSLLSHSHIRIVPRDDSELADNSDYHDDVPTFRSPSLQFPPAIDDLPLNTTVATHVVPNKKTFAEMARRYNKKDILEGEEKPTNGPVSLAGLIKLQPNRKKGNKSWRPLQLSDFGDDANDDGVEDSEHEELSALTEDFSKQLGFQPAMSAQNTYYPRASPFDLPPLQTDLSPASRFITLPPQGRTPCEVLSAFNKADGEDISPTNIRHRHSGIVDDYVRLFGKQLPDPIRLHEEIGTFDGQVTFIAHPNRDVSAHQWSESSFQWMNIGLYSHTRRKIEGSLASDRLRYSTIPYNTIEYFKAVAEQRENQAANIRLKENKPPEPSSMHGVDPLRRPTLVDTDHLASLSSASGSTGERLPTLNNMDRLCGDSSQNATPVSHTVTREALEDPFVTPARISEPVIPNSIDFSQGNNGAIGSMDFSYEFPARSSVSRTVFQPQLLSEAEAQRHVFIQREQERLEAMRRNTTSQPHSDPSLREVGFGEEALSEYETSTTRSTLSRPLTHLSPEDVQNRRMLKSQLAALGDSALRPSHHVDQRVAVPNVHALQGSARALFPSPGLTVANPTRVTSTLNASAAPYTRPAMFNQVFEGSESEVTAVNAQPTANLRFSDPDGIRQPRNYDIANGLAQQPPTLQSFRGPFFADQMPTTHDPTTPLASQIDEQAKLENWFRDGQRPARQQEYCKSIMATANANAKARGSQELGTIGDIRVQVLSKFDNTPAFVRLYENLSEYLEDSRTGVPGDYFTRAWKRPPLHLCDLGPDGNNSFFENSRVASPQQTRGANRSHKTPTSTNFGGFGIVDSWMRKTSHGVVGDGGLGGPLSGRY